MGWQQCSSSLLSYTSAQTRRQLGSSHIRVHQCLPLKGSNLGLVGGHLLGQGCAHCLAVIQLGREGDSDAPHHVHDPSHLPSQGPLHQLLLPGQCSLPCLCCTQLSLRPWAITQGISLSSLSEKKKKDYAFLRQFNEKPSTIPGCPVAACQTWLVTMELASYYAYDFVSTCPSSSTQR